MSDSAWARAAVRFWLNRLIEQTAEEYEREARRWALAAANVRRWVA